MLPFSFYILENFKENILGKTLEQGKVVTAILAKSTVNILLMNGGDLSASKVDAQDMLSILIPLKRKGIVEADSIFLSSNKKLNGHIIASFFDKKILKFKKETKTFSSSEISQFFITGKKGYRKFYNKALKENCFEFISVGRLFNKKPVCIGRIVLSEKSTLKIIPKIKKIILIGAVSISLLVAFISYFFSRLISKPIETLTENVKLFHDTETFQTVRVTFTGEIGVLSNAYNHLIKKIEEKINQLQNTNKKLEKLDALKNDFLAKTSHELKTPLNGIIGLSEAMIDGVYGELPDDVLTDLKIITNRGKHLNSLINNILDYSKLRYNDLSLNFSSINLNSVVVFVLEILKPLYINKNIKIINKIPEDFRNIKGDVNRIEQIFTNLLHNAIQFTDKGTIEIYATEDKKLATIYIADTGIGIPEERVTNIFNSFEQLEDVDTRTHDGIGLGLPIAKELIEIHDGTISLKTKLGKGTTFFFTLPFATKEDKEIDLSHTIPHTNIEETYTTSNLAKTEHNFLQENFYKGEKPLILIVDDEMINRKILVNQFSIHHYDTITADSGYKAIDILEQTDKRVPDLILLDIMMPGISGYETCKKIRERFSIYQLPILMLTAKTETSSIIKGFESGANDYILKPCNSKELFSRVESFLKLKDLIEKDINLTEKNKEFTIAYDILLSLLPEKKLDLDCLQMEIWYEPMEEIGGDLYDFFKIDDERIGVLIADVSGHGLSAALLASMLKISFSIFKDLIYEPAELFRAINNSLFDKLKNRFITAAYLILNIKTGELFYSNAGHWPLYILNKKNLNELYVKGGMIGLSKEMKFNQKNIQLTKGDRIVLFTDAVVEARNKEGELFGEKNFISLLESNAKLPSVDFLNHTRESIVQWQESEIFEDDVTMLVMDFDRKI